MGLSGGLDLMVLDVMLPRRDGFDVVRNLRAAQQMLPTIMVTARDAMTDIVRGLDLGADDYLTKPFALDVLLARVRALGRRGPAAYPSDLQYEDLVLNSRTHELQRGDRSVSLTRTEYALLETLMRRAGLRCFPRRAGGSRLGRWRGSPRGRAVCFHSRVARQDRFRWRTPAFAHGPRSRIHAAGRRSLKNTSLSLRLTAWFSTIFLCGFLLFGIVMWVQLAYALGQGRDRTLTRRAARVTELLEATTGDSPDTREARFEQLTDVVPEGNLIQVFDASGRRVLPRVSHSPDFPWPASFTLRSRDDFTNVDYRGREFRLLIRPIGSGAILVAGQLEDNRNMMAQFKRGLLWASPAMMILCALGGYFLNRRALHPVDQITATLRSISIGNLSQRLPMANTGDELQRLAETCNAMLGRLEDAVERINRFTADASHELRSPIALIRTVAEYALCNQQIDADSREAFQEILAESLETGQLLEDMLTLARADAGYGSIAFEPVDLGELVEDAAARLRPLAEPKNQSVSVHAAKPLWISGERSSLRRLVSILLDNAVKYTPAGGCIEIHLMPTASAALLTVRDSGIGISEELLPRIFDGFVRADPSRRK